MSKLNYIMRYFATNYPYNNELSKARLTKMVYLADWFSAMDEGRQLTDIKWFFDHYGPYVLDVYYEAMKDRKLKVEQEFTAFGTPKETIYIRDINDSNLGLDKLSKKEKNILDKVILETKYLNWSEFIDYVYNTYPIRTQKRYSYLDLKNLALEEKNKLA